VDTPKKLKQMLDNTSEMIPKLLAGTIINDKAKNFVPPYLRGKKRATDIVTQKHRNTNQKHKPL